MGTDSKAALDPQKLKQIELLVLHKFGRKMSQVDKVAHGQGSSWSR